MSQVMAISTAVGCALVAGFVLRVGWAIGGMFVRWIGVPDPISNLTVNNVFTGAQIEVKEEAFNGYVN